MSSVSSLASALCYLCVAVTVISLFLPQKRTRKIFGFVIGLFVICSLIACFKNVTINEKDSLLSADNITLPKASDSDYTEMVKQQTAENLVAAADELLRSEGFEAKDIRISLKISDEGRIYVNDVVIYISKEDVPRTGAIRDLIYRNLSKEPRVYVEKEKME